MKRLQSLFYPIVQQRILNSLYKKPFHWLPFQLRIRLQFERFIAAYVLEQCAAAPARTDAVPKTIHAIWVGGPMPLFRRHLVERWRELLPDYEIVVWDEKSLDIEGPDFSRAAYRQNDFRKLADYWRLALLKKHGGIYLDCDTLLLKRIPDEWLTLDLVLAKQIPLDTLYTIANSFIAAKKENIIVSGLLEFIETRIDSGRVAVWTGPNLFTCLYYAMSNAHAFARTNTMILPYGVAAAERKRAWSAGLSPSEIWDIRDESVCTPTQLTAAEELEYERQWETRRRGS